MTIILQERCTGADTISIVAQILYRSRTHLQSMLLQSNAVEDFYVHLVCFLFTCPGSVNKQSLWSGIWEIKKGH